MGSRKHRGNFRTGRALMTLGVFVTTSALLLPEGRAFVRTTFLNGAAAFWSDAQATLNLQLGCPAGPLPNWGPCWDDAAADAVTHWNNAAARFRFFRQTPSIVADPCAHTDRTNTAAFSSTICGMGFGSALAVTISVGNAITGALIDADTLFGMGRSWSTYPGPLQRDAFGMVTVYDFHRVAIHEFGHVLGLGHPDAVGQSVTAIMNSRVSDIDDLQPDDIAGVNAIYPTMDHPTANLENPQPDESVSGISLISGWVCDANRIDVQIDGTITVQATYGTSRADTRPVCGDENNGFGLLLNWNLLRDGSHTIVAFRDGVEFARRTFIVTTLGQEFLSGASGRYPLPNFAGRNVIVEWRESLQNFVIVGVE